jgi:16S rRNA (guanine527-N7)-methyltransferase
VSAGLIAVHRELLDRWRGAMNLVGPGGVEEHYLDAELGLRTLTPRGHWADLGSGAGFPGIIFAALFPEVPIDLVESRSKRAAFLREVVARAGAAASQVQVLRTRVEDLPAGRYDGVLARAFATPDRVLRHAERVLVPGGAAVLFLGSETPLPPHPAFEVVHEEHYVVEGKPRRAVELRRGQRGVG